jgi:hypothetical protein
VCARSRPLRRGSVWQPPLVGTRSSRTHHTESVVTDVSVLREEDQTTTTRSVAALGIESGKRILWVATGAYWCSSVLTTASRSRSGLGRRSKAARRRRTRSPLSTRVGEGARRRHRRSALLSPSLSLSVEMVLRYFHRCCYMSSPL